MKYIKEHWRFLLFIVLFGIVGGIFTTLFAVQSMTPENMELTLQKFGSKEGLVAFSMVQSVLYAFICGFFGIILSCKTGLWKKISLEGRKVLAVIVVSVVGGVIFIFSDYFFFGHFNEAIRQSFIEKPSLNYIIASFTWGAVVEEVMLRLFFMSLIAFILWKLFCRKKKTSDGDEPDEKDSMPSVPYVILVISNILSALLFALGHLPGTVQVFGNLNFLLVARCLIMNGMYGLVFGALYIKCGIQYSMLAHFGVHFVSKLIWIIFI